MTPSEREPVIRAGWRPLGSDEWAFGNPGDDNNKARVVRFEEDEWTWVVCHGHKYWSMSDGVASEFDAIVAASKALGIEVTNG